MNRLLTRLFPIVFLTFLARNASADAGGAYVPFIAVDAVNGTFREEIKNELDRSKIRYELLRAPITSEQLKGAKILLVCGAFRTEMTKPIEGVKDHRLYLNEEIATIDNFVNQGGVLIGAGISWTWEFKGYGNKDPKDFPLNQIGEALDFSVLGAGNVDKFERKFLNIVPVPKSPVGLSISNVKIKGANDKFIRSNNGFCGVGAKRGNGHIYIIGHQGILLNNPEFISSVFLGLSPQKGPNTELVKNDPKESKNGKQVTNDIEPSKKSETHEGKQDAPPIPKTLPEVAISNINPLELLAQEGPNMIAWVTSPLDVNVPNDFRANISLLRENILDYRGDTQIAIKSYAAGAELCDNLIFSIDKKEKQQIDAKLKVAQAKARSPLSNVALDVKRNYKMSWPQYEREVRQREVLSEQKGDNVEVRTREVEAHWIVTAGDYRKALDGKYTEFRASMRKK